MRVACCPFCLFIPPCEVASVLLQENWSDKLETVNRTPGNSETGGITSFCCFISTVEWREISFVIFVRCSHDACSFCTITGYRCAIMFKDAKSCCLRFQKRFANPFETKQTLDIKMLAKVRVDPCENDTCSTCHSVLQTSQHLVHFLTL